MKSDRSKFCATIVVAMSISMSLLPVSSCKARNSAISGSKSISGKVADEVVTSLREIDAATIRVDTLYGELEARSLSDRKPVVAGQSSNADSVGTSDADSLAPKTEEPQNDLISNDVGDDEFFYEDMAVHVDSVVSMLTAVLGRYPEYDSRISKEIDSLNKSVSTLRTIFLLPPRVLEKSAKMQLGEADQPLTLPQIRGQLSKLKAKSNTVDAQVLGERAATESKRRQAIRDAHSQRIKEKEELRQSYKNSANEYFNLGNDLNQQANDNVDLQNFYSARVKANKKVSYFPDDHDKSNPKDSYYLNQYYKNRVTELRRLRDNARAQRQRYEDLAEAVSKEIATMRGNYPQF